MSQLRLSEELIPLIILQLAHEKHTLYSLLTVNKFFFHTAAPILYKNPFQPFFWPNYSEPIKRKILYLLLASSNLLPELLKHTTGILDLALTDWDPPTGPFTVNYLDYYTEINYSEWENISEAPFSYSVGNSSLETGFGQITHLLFCNYNAVKIRNIYLPIFNVKPYFPIVVSLSSVRRINFHRFYEDGYCTNDQNIVTIQDAIEFVKILVETFDNTLTEIKIPDLTDLKRYGIRSDVQISDIIRILIRPRVIDVHDSYDFCQYLQGPTTEHLRVFGGPLMQHSQRIQNWDSASLFQRCPKLEKIRFMSSQPNSFKWAVERRDLLHDFDSALSSTSNIKLPPLQEVDMLCQHCPTLPIVQDIVYAFRNTIKSITVSDKILPNLHPDSLSWDWLLPNLVKIKISEADLSLFDFGSLNLCPSLQELYLSSKYDFREHGTPIEFGPVLKLSSLRKIKLESGITSKFDFDSLKYSPLLESLILRESNSFLPMRSADSPCWTWTWDWNLPNLKELFLAGESAVLFQFRLLESCPPLEFLKLVIYDYHRSLFLDEIPTKDSPLPTEFVKQARSRKKIKQNSIFILQGKWELSGKTIPTLLQRYMSHITDIQLTDIQGLTAIDVINATKELTRIKVVRCTICLTDTDIEQSGMHVIDRCLYDKGWRSIGRIDSVNYIMGYKANINTIRPYLRT
ncbi:hypothetical protein K7432_003847 [Basidiobolus ranarum]|uniref:F-box domain-containing protein n=1 Tax=Basidiobolus ranarum TaxID=34480 RepID=A0ABR2WZB2_9FUNG